jgi:hypothetical protein
MPRLAVVLLGMVLWVGCSTGGSHPQGDPSASQPAEGSLQGVTSDYSIRLSEMPNYDDLDSDSVMRQGLVAGDKTVHIAAAAFRSGEYYALDLIVNNRETVPMTLHRDDVRLVDSSGQWMTPVADFREAHQLGLRGRSERRTSTFPYDGLGLYDNGGYTDQVGYSSNNLGGKTSGPAAAQPDDGSYGNGLVNFDWNTTVPAAPDPLEVPGGEGRAWWAYWKAETTPVFPLTAFVTVEGRHLIFIFED